MGNSTPIRNRLSLDIPAKSMQATQAALQTLTEQLNPHLVHLSLEERRKLPKMGPRSSDFVARAMSYMRAMPQYLPGFVELDEFQKDLDAMATLEPLRHQIDATAALIDTSVLVAGSEAYAAALSIYEALKTAAKRGSPEAQAAAADLAARLGPRGPAKGMPKANGAAPASPLDTSDALPAV